METVTTESSAAEEDECSDSEVLCLMRVGRNSDWLRLFDNTEITIGRGLDVTYQLLSPSCPLMISRLHCTFKQREDGQWTVTDRKSLNGVWVNGNRIPAEEAHQLRLGDSIQLGVPVIETKVEFDYILVQRPLKDIKLYLAQGHKEGAKAAHVSKKPKRKLTVEDVEPSTSKPKLYRCSAADKSFAKPCPLSPVKRQQRLSHSQSEETGPSRQVQEVDRPTDGSNTLCDLDNLQMYSQNILMLREQVDNTQRQVASLEGEPQKTDPLREEQVRELQGQLEALRAKMHRMETLEKSFSETKRQLEAEKTQQQEELLKRQLEEALQEQKKVIDELALSRQGFEEILSAKNKELEVTKEEKEKARAQKEEVVTQVTEVLENELQCIICSELFIEAVILNCAHSFCCYCIQQWRKKKDECPICRQAIKSQTRCLALDNCINSMVENLSLDMKTRRQTLITERKENRLHTTMARSPYPPRAKLNPDKDDRKMRRIIAEDPDWSLAIVPNLTNLCLQSIVSNFEEKPIFEDLTPIHKDFVQERLSTSLNLHVTTNLINDGIYWKRCCEQRWDHCDVSHYGHSWKRMFFERHMENMIELFIPDVTDTQTVLEMVPLCKDYVKRLDISQLLPPIKEPQTEDEESEVASENEYDGPSMDHFNFNILLDKLTNLEELHLVFRVKNCGMNFEWKMFEMTDRDCESLAKALNSCKTLKLLRLHQSHIDDKKCRLLVKYLLDHPSLRELDFSHNLIGDRGARAVGKLLTRSQLETLNMCDNNITGPGAKAIAHALSRNPTLLSLNLRLNRLRDEGGQAIGKALLSNNVLRHLHLGANEVTVPTAIALSEVLVQNNTLKNINLSCNNLGVDGGKALEEAMSLNTCITECDIRLTEVDVHSVSFINQVVHANQSSEQKRRVQERKTK